MLVDDGNVEGMVEFWFVGDLCFEEGLRVEDWFLSVVKCVCIVVYFLVVGWEGFLVLYI